MNESEIKNKVYCILFNEHLDNNAKFNKIVDLVEEYYDMGSRDSDKAMFDLLAGMFDEDIEF